MSCSLGVCVRLILLSAAGAGASWPDQTRDVALERHEFRETHMGSEFRILLYTSDEPAARAASRAAFDRIAALDRAASDYEPESELNRLCDQAGGPPVPVSDDLFPLLEHSLAFARQSDGLFDPTIKPLTKLWRRAFRQKQRPDAAELEAARTRVDYHELRLDPAHQTAALGRSGMRLDLGGIAKGYAADQAQKALKAHGVTSALVAAAGDIVVSGPPPGTPGWRIGIGPLEDPTAQPLEILILSHAAVSTSGDTERYAQIEGVRYSHIVDPRSGLGHVDRASVSVVSPDGTTSDACATILYLLGPEAGFAWLERTQPKASAIYFRQGERGLERMVSPHWLGQPVPVPAPAANPGAENAGHLD